MNHQKRTVKTWETQYSSKTHSYLRNREVGWKLMNNLVYGAKSPQIHMRPILLKTIRNMSKHYRMSHGCVHLAIRLLDYFMDNHNLKFDVILLVMFACLTLAAKVEEQCVNVPNIKKICTYTMSKNFTNLYFRQIEMKILKFFDCNIAVPTVVHFIEFYREYFYCDTRFNYNEFTDFLKDKFDTMILIYQDMSLENLKLISYNPSMVAASIVLCTRHELGMTPCWTTQLRNVTGYLKKDLVKCCSLLGRNVLQHRKCQPIDEGYFSYSSDFQSPIKKKRTHIDVPNISSKRIAFHRKSFQL